MDRKVPVMDKTATWIRSHWIILGFAMAKLVIHLVTATHYGFHRGSYPTRKLYDDWEESWQESKGLFIRE
ncbi:MAG: hypothetical protein KAT15_25050 [Bacteroidales bacterium]|nr:hypothetical protein [Bacteroidales bacterium]